MKRIGRTFTDGTVKCPFCNFVTDRFSTNPACGGCYVEFYENRRGEIVFDTERKTEMGRRYTYARAFSGMQLGQIEMPGEENTE